MRLSPKLSLFLTLAWTLLLFGGWALLAEMTSEAAPPAYDPGLEFKDPVHIPVGDDPRGIAIVGDKVYVANHDDDSLSVINANTLTVTQIITAGISNPCSIAYNPHNGYLYVTNRPDTETVNGTVAVISPTTGLTVTDPIPVGKKPTGIVFNPNDGYIYVAMNAISTESVVEVISDTTVTDTITISHDWPAHIAVKEASNLLYVTSYSTVSIIDGSTRTVTKEIPLNLDDLWGIAVNQNTGWVYAAAATAGELGRIQPDDTVADAIKPEPPASLRMVAVDPIQNLVFVTQDETATSPDPDPEGEHVFVYDPDTNDWVDELEITVQQDPERGIAFDPVRRRLYVSNGRSDTVTVIQIIGKVYLPIIMKSSS
jgi:YVTN family beta-propeller protein